MFSDLWLGIPVTVMQQPLAGQWRNGLRRIRDADVLDASVLLWRRRRRWRWWWISIAARLDAVR
jgi:hypothetical protein